MTTQIICTGNEYKIADSTNSELPIWPVQDEGGHWHYEQFAGQRCYFTQREVHFGFMATEVAEHDVPLDADGDLDLDELFRCNDGSIWRSI